MLLTRRLPRAAELRSGDGPRARPPLGGGRARAHRLAAGLALALALLGCGSKTGLVVEELPPCESDAECDDGLF
ncbi:MAG TPA: hypothetical protein RMI62_08290, partial [Polyangiaceae bacterium LLY-WYZ-15_(1-7)]|nr:hypothetical protein [Polyangiaceae bacterium LLY-WYZ-15_(1-7)]